VKTLHYKAFISYSHQDEAWARWLQSSLESYRVPKHLVGSKGSFGIIPSRLLPIFRDREDLSSASDLSSKIRDELAASESLVLICSPASAQSRWVNEEIRHFRQLGRADRIFALIVAGDPQAADADQQCFPPALTEQSNGGQHEPLAADARPYADGKALSKLKLVAGILGIRLDELRRRDAQRRRKTWLVSTTVAALVILLTAALAFTTISTRKTVALQRDNTEELLGYMLGNLKSLDPIMGLEVIDQNNAQVMNYLHSLGFEDMAIDQLVEQAMTWRTEGQDLHERGMLDAAMEPLQKSRAGFIELYQREQGSPRALFELGQAEFWMGYTYLNKGELDEAQASFTRYGALTRRLVNADPNNAVYVMELAYTFVNLGGVERQRQNPDVEKTLQLNQSAMEYNQIALVLDPGNAVYRQDLSNTMAFLADSWMDKCDLGRAFEFRRQGVELSRQLLEEMPAEASRKRLLAAALSGWAIVQWRMSLLEPAIDGFRESEKLFAEMARVDPGNLRLLWATLYRRQWIALRLGAMGDVENSWKDSSKLAAELNAIFAAGMNADFDAAIDLAAFRINYSMLAYRVGELDVAAAELRGAMDSLAALVQEKPKNRFSLYQLVRGAYQQWRQSGQLPNAQANAAIEQFLTGRKSIESCDDAGLAAQLAVMRGDKALASSYTSYLRQRGYFEPDFVAFCQEQQICD
jgi:eukaryotic-like serine/threonine-protein kinase